MPNFEVRRPYRTQWEHHDDTVGAVLRLGDLRVRVERHGRKDFSLGWPTRQTAEEASAAFIQTLAETTPKNKVAILTQTVLHKNGKSQPSKTLKHVKLPEARGKILKNQSSAEQLRYMAISSKLGDISWSNHNIDTPNTGEIVLSVGTSAPTTALFEPLYERTVVPELRDLADAFNSEIIATSRRRLFSGEQIDAIQLLAERLGAMSTASSAPNLVDQ